jgi:threonine dehydratase
MNETPTIAALQTNREKLLQWIVETPVWQGRTDALQNIFGKTEVFFKLEFWQQAGSFKARGALTTLMNLDEHARQKGVVAASAGNHAVAVSFAAKTFGVSAKVIMPRTASSVRLEKCKNYGAEVILVDSLADTLIMMPAIAKEEQRIPIHPFEGPFIVLGTGTIGLEFLMQIPQLDAVIVPIGGGGLIAGIAAAIKQVKPSCQVFGVEPDGAPTLYESLKAGKPITLAKVSSIADSLAAPCAAPYTFSLCQKYVDEVVLVSDTDLTHAMVLLFNELKLAVEPAAAASLAALLGPLKQRLAGKRVGLMVSGTNIDLERFYSLIKPVYKVL